MKLYRLFFTLQKTHIHFHFMLTVWLQSRDSSIFMCCIRQLVTRKLRITISNARTIVLNFISFNFFIVRFPTKPFTLRRFIFFRKDALFYAIQQGIGHSWRVREMYTRVCTSLYVNGRLFPSQPIALRNRTSFIMCKINTKSSSLKSHFCLFFKATFDVLFSSTYLLIYFCVNTRAWSVRSILRQFDIIPPPILTCK